MGPAAADGYRLGRTCGQHLELLCGAVYAGHQSLLPPDVAVVVVDRPPSSSLVSLLASTGVCSRYKTTDSGSSHDHTSRSPSDGYTFRPHGSKRLSQEHRLHVLCVLRIAIKYHILFNRQPLKYAHIHLPLLRITRRLPRLSRSYMTEM